MLAKSAGLILVLALATDWALHRTTTFPAPHARGGILITGGGSGIGKSAAVALAARGFTVFVGVRQQAQLEALRVVAAETATPLVPLLMDVTKEEQVLAARDAVEAELQQRGGLPLVGLVNNAGIHRGGDAGTAEHTATVRAVMEVNFFGSVRVTDAFLPLLRSAAARAAGGRIVNLSSLSGLFANSGNAPYCASKFAMEAWSDATRRQLLRPGVAVSVVEPGFINTGMHRSDGADGTDVSTDAIVHALTSPHPRTRYKVANVFGVPAWAFARLLWLLPDKAVDMMPGA